MKKFLLSLIDSSNPNSSKRFSGLVTLFTCIVFGIIATIKNKGLCPEFMFNSLLIFAGCCFGFNMAENIFKGRNTQSIPDSTDTPDTPQDSTVTTMPISTRTMPSVTPVTTGTAVVDNPDA